MAFQFNCRQLLNFQALVDTVVPVRAPFLNIRPTEHQFSIAHLPRITLLHMCIKRERERKKYANIFRLQKRCACVIARLCHRVDRLFVITSKSFSYLFYTCCILFPHWPKHLPDEHSSFPRGTPCQTQFLEAFQ